jgi:quercetin dioxygenase-like cupin family protein
LAAVLLTGAVATTALSGIAVTRSVGGRRPNATSAARTAVAPALAVTVAGPDAVTVVNQVYDPGEDSGWHMHPGIHAVAILSGALTVYDEQCRPETYTPGHPYVGGQHLHLVRNETDEPVAMVVTYLNPIVPANSTSHPGGPLCWGEHRG